MARQTANGLALMGETKSLRDVDQAIALSLVLADFEGTGGSELALGIVDHSSVTVYLYSIDQTMAPELFPMTMAKVVTISQDSWPRSANVKYALPTLLLN
jgi:hypothetical protein